MFLLHYFTNSNSEHIYNSITDYPTAIQKEIAKKLSHQPGRALRRFDKPSTYLDKRKATEKWLRDNFKTWGNWSVTTTPIYFILGENAQLRNDFGYNVCALQLQLEDVADKDISFTIGDSVGLFYSNADKEVYTKPEILDILKDPIFIQKCFDHLPSYHKYIEAQLWNRDYLKKAKLISYNNYKLLY